MPSPPGRHIYAEKPTATRSGRCPGAVSRSPGGRSEERRHARQTLAAGPVGPVLWPGSVAYATPRRRETSRAASRSPPPGPEAARAPLVRDGHGPVPGAHGQAHDVVALLFKRYAAIAESTPPLKPTAILPCYRSVCASFSVLKNRLRSRRMAMRSAIGGPSVVAKGTLMVIDTNGVGNVLQHAANEVGDLRRGHSGVELLRFGHFIARGIAWADAT